VSQIFNDLSKLFPSDQISQTRSEIEIHSIDKWHASFPPDIVVFAQCTEDVVKVMKYANEHEIPVYTRGAGIGYVGGCVPVNGGIALSVARMNTILDLAPTDGVIVTQPGVITGDLQSVVREIGWYYPPDPASLKECSIGGNIATNAGGPRCLKYGVTKQYVLGLEVVSATGEILRLGGRCHKNKTGFDLATLICGSEGMLGIVTEATLRIIPHPETRAMLGVSFEDFSAAAAAVQAVLNNGTLPSALEITDAFTLAAARDYLGKDNLPSGDAYLMIEIDGRQSSVSRELASLKDFLLNLGAISITEAPDEEACEKIWQLRRDFSYSLKHTGLTKLNEDVVVPRSKLVDLVNFARDLQVKTGISIACFGHAGDGNIHTNLMVEDYTDPETRIKADNALDLLFNWVLENSGTITGEHGVGLAKKRWINKALGNEVMNTHKMIKTALDPKRILNPGKFLD